MSMMNNNNSSIQIFKKISNTVKKHKANKVINTNRTNNKSNKKDNLKIV